MEDRSSMDQGASPAVMLLGDTHANTDWTVSMIEAAAGMRVDLILQLGDFGYWPMQMDGAEFLASVETALAEHDMFLWFIDGNHEDHHHLLQVPVDRTTGRRPVSAHVEHLPRGFRWTWAGRRWVAAGGAVSMDVHFRQEEVTWFPEEELTDVEVDAIVSDGPADVLVSHDAPFGTPFLYSRYRQSLHPSERNVGWPVAALHSSDAHQGRLLRLVEGLGVRQVFHGHHHVGYEDVLVLSDGTETSVTGLGCDGQQHTESLRMV